jgi:hypothetical protein
VRSVKLTCGVVGNCKVRGVMVKFGIMGNL